MLDSAFANAAQHTQQGFLADIVGKLCGSEANRGLDANQLAEILRKMLFGRVVAISQPPNIVRIE